MTYLKVLLRGQSVGCTRSVYLSQGQFVQAPELSRHYSIITVSMFPLMSSSVSLFVFPQKASTVSSNSDLLSSPGVTCPFD